jgi:hypothetical protein
VAQRPQRLDHHFLNQVVDRGPLLSPFATKGLRPGTDALRFTAGADPAAHEVRFSIR